MPELDFSDISDQNRHVVYGFDHYFFDIIEAVNKANPPDEIGIGFFIEVGGSGIFIVFFEGFEDLVDRDSQAAEAVGIQGNFVLFDISAKGAYFGNAGCSEKLAFDDPVLDRTQVAQGVA